MTLKQSEIPKHSSPGNTFNPFSKFLLHENVSTVHWSLGLYLSKLFFSLTPPFKSLGSCHKIQDLSTQTPHKTFDFPVAAVTAAPTALITLIWICKHIVIRFCRVIDFVLNSGPSHKLLAYVSLSHYFTISFPTLFDISCCRHFSAILTLNLSILPPSDTEGKSMI